VLEDKKPPTRWVWYEVKVGDVEASFPAKGKQSVRNFVNCTFYCRALLKDETGTELDSFVTAVPSVRGQPEEATRIEMPKSP